MVEIWRSDSEVKGMFIGKVLLDSVALKLGGGSSNAILRRTTLSNRKFEPICWKPRELKLDLRLLFWRWNESMFENVDRLRLRRDRTDSTTLNGYSSQLNSHRKNSHAFAG